jgi:hypothetical protein
MIFISLKTVSESSSKFVSHSVVAGEATFTLLAHRGIAVLAEELDELVDDELADCGRSRFNCLCFMVPAFSFAKGI